MSTKLFKSQQKVGKGFEKALSVLADDTGAVGIKEISRALNWGKDPAQSQGDIGFVKDAWKRFLQLI